MQNAIEFIANCFLRVVLRCCEFLRVNTVCYHQQTTANMLAFNYILYCPWLCLLCARDSECFFLCFSSARSRLCRLFCSLVKNPLIADTSTMTFQPFLSRSPCTPLLLLLFLSFAEIFTANCVSSWLCLIMNSHNFNSIPFSGARASDFLYSNEYKQLQPMIVFINRKLHIFSFSSLL